MYWRSLEDPEELLCHTCFMKGWPGRGMPRDHEYRRTKNGRERLMKIKPSGKVRGEEMLKQTTTRNGWVGG